MEEFQKEFSDISMILEMDRTNAPYGEKTDEQIKEFTKNGVTRLFDQ